MGDNTLSKRLRAINLATSDKGGISTMRLFKQIGIPSITASRIPHEVRVAMRHWHNIYRLHNLIECAGLLSRCLSGNALAGRGI